MNKITKYIDALPLSDAEKARCLTQACRPFMKRWTLNIILLFVKMIRRWVQ
jgi:hypothetical protein